MVRFDDLIRTERYFSATLLPAVLFHEIDGAHNGLKAFLRLASESVRDTGKSAFEWTLPSALEREEIELITEFHIARDLERAGLPLGETESSKRDAPDLVIIAGSHVLVCEAKFFTKCSPRDINPQLKSQRQQFNHLFKNRPDLKTSHWHIAILPVKYDGDYDCDAVITWDQITELSADVLGSDHYVTKRFINAMEKYRIEFGDPVISNTEDHSGSFDSAGTKQANYDGISDFAQVLKLCQERGDLVQVGHRGGVRDLINRDAQYIARKPWKWRYPEQNRGTIVNANWMSGTEFAQLINALERSSNITGEPVVERQRNYDGVEGLANILELCSLRGDSIQVGHTGGTRDLENRDYSYLTKKRWKWRNRDTNLGTISRNNWID